MVFLYGLSMRDTYEEFGAKKARLCIKFESHGKEAIMLPCVTASPNAGFKTPGDFAKG